MEISFLDEKKNNVISYAPMRLLNPFTAVYNARNMPGENTATLMLLWCYHNHCRDLHQIFSCLFETFCTMSEICFLVIACQFFFSTAENT